MINIYRNSDTIFTGNGICAISNAQDVCIKHEINGNYELTFKVPKCEKWKYILEENIVKCDGKLFRIKSIDGGAVTAQAIYFDASYHHITYIANMINMTPSAIMTQLFSDTSVHIMTNSECAAAEMEWVTTPTDFFEASKITPIGGLETLIKTLNEQMVHCELYVDNYNIALVKQIGKDNGYNIDTKLNAKSMTFKRDTSSLINRIYPYGKDDLTISSYMSDGRVYINSEDSVSTYGLREGYVDFSDVEKAKELYDSALWQFSSSNIDRIDVPKYSITVDFIDISKTKDFKDIHKVNLGDTVTVYDRDYYNTVVEQRITAIEYYPYEPNKTKFTVGNTQNTTAKLFEGMVQGQAQYAQTTTANGQLKTSWLECMQKNESILINNTLASKKDIAQYKTGALFVAEDESCAVAIINGKIAISSQKQNGEWYWTTTADGGKVIVNETFTGALYTEQCNIRGIDGQLDITNNVLKFTDKNGKVRMYMGVSVDGNYMFQMRDSSGNLTMYINDSGEAVFSGNLETLKDAIVGATLQLKDVNSEVGGTLNINGTHSIGSGYQTVLQIRSKNDRGIDIDAYTDGGKDVIIRGRNIYMGTPDGTSGNVYANSGIVATREWVQSHFGS